MADISFSPPGSGDYRALAFQGSQVYACHAQLSGLLRTHLGKPTPVCWPSRSWTRRERRWTGTRRAPCSPSPSFPQKRRKPLKRGCRASFPDIEELAASLQTDNDPYKSLCGTMLHLATRFSHAGMPVRLPPLWASPQARRSPCWSAGAWPFLPPRRRKASMQWEPRRSPPSRKRLSPAAHPAIRIYRPRRRSDGTPHRRPPRPRLWWKASRGGKKLLMLLLGLLLALLLFWGLHFLFPWVPPLPLPAGVRGRPPLNPLSLPCSQRTPPACPKRI